MPKHYSSDLRDWTDALEGAESGWSASHRMALFLGAIVSWATTDRGSHTAEASNVVCGWRSASGRCVAEVVVGLDGETDHITWECPDCGTRGEIRGWEDSPWDRRSDADRESSAETWSRFERSLNRLAAGDARDATLAITLRRLALRALRLDATPSVDAAIPIAESKLGGEPDLPVDEAWPESEGRPLPFVAQLSLSDCAAFDESGVLPRDGHLWFFFDASRSTWGLSGADSTTMRVVFRPEGGGLIARRAPPAGTVVHRAYRWSSRPVASLPNDLQSTERVVEPEPRPARELKNPFTGELMSIAARAALPSFREPADDLSTDAIAAVEAFRREHLGAVRPRHQLLGHPVPIQDGGQFGRPLAVAARSFGLDGEQTIVRTAEPRDANTPRWRLLLQLSSECEQDRRGRTKPGLEPGREPLIFADGGVLYWLIRDDDLAARRFDRVWVAMDCG